MEGKVGLKPKSLAIIIVAFSTILTTIGQVFLKIGSSGLSLSPSGLITNYPLIAGAFFYGISAILMIIALRHGDLSVVYPVISLSFVWVTLLSLVFLHEPLTVYKLSGIPLILAGITFIGIGGSRG